MAARKRHPLPDQQNLERGTQNALLRQVRPLIERNQMDVLWAIQRLTNSTRPDVQIGMRQIANELGSSESTARRAVRKLEEIGFLSNEEVIGPNGREPNQYRIIWSEVRESALTGRFERIEETYDDHCRRDESSGRWARKTESLEVFAMAGDGQQELFGTEDAGPVNLTEPARSNRPGRSGQFDRAGQVNLTGPSISSSSFNSHFHSPPPEKPRPTLLDAEWLVVVDKLRIFGVWEQRAWHCVKSARERGVTPQTVEGLIDHAAKKVIALDESGRPIAHWRMPCNDALDVSQPQPPRIYWWGPAALLVRIDRQDTCMWIGSEWPPVNAARRKEFIEASGRLPNNPESVPAKSERPAAPDAAESKVIPVPLLSDDRTADDPQVATITAVIVEAITPQAYQYWFKHKTAITIREDALIVRVGSHFLKTWLNSQFREQLHSVAASVLGHTACVRFEIASEASGGCQPTESPSTNQDTRRIDIPRSPNTGDA